MPPLQFAPPTITLSNLSDYATDESEGVLYQERFINAGLHLGGIAYGAHLMVYGACTYYLAKTPRFSRFLQLYTTVLLVLSSINYGTNLKYGEMVWIDFRGYPDGPLDFYLFAQQLPMHVAAEVTMILVTLLVDLLVIYRTYMVWDKDWRVVVIPLAMLALAIVIAMIRAIAVAYNIQTLLSHEVIGKGLFIYWILSFSLNVIVTSLIIGRLCYARMEVRKQLGVQYTTVYSQVVTLIVESTAPYTVVSIVFVVFFSLDHPAFMLFLVLYPQIQCISSEAIILLVLRHQRDRSLNHQDEIQERCVNRISVAMLSSAQKEFKEYKLSDLTVPSVQRERSDIQEGWHVVSL